jgi:hypothetical protein
MGNTLVYDGSFVIFSGPGGDRPQKIVFFLTIKGHRIPYYNHLFKYVKEF